MANRVLIGDRAGTMGMWISRPGYNVMTAADADMLFVASNSLNTRSFQTAQEGSFALTTDQSIDIVFPYMGFLPIILTWTDQYFWNPVDQGAAGFELNSLELQFMSSTVARMTARNQYYPSGSLWSQFYYLVVNQSYY
ncbi:MAG: hypothetical protein DI537_13720 [Stutzerimonas stutzeri]|nr:MAG: hypothetical protein DI537_13720 [Stutzerimonas stutzeri]